MTLRLFNPVGAHKSGLIGEIMTDNPPNLMPNIAKVALRQREQFTMHVYSGKTGKSGKSEKSNTKDGTGIYI